MGALAAFLGGAGGAGLIDMTRRWDRNDEMAQAQAQRQQEMAEQRAFREEQSALDRNARFGAGGGSAVSRSRGGGGSADPEAAQGNRRDAAVFDLMQSRGMSQPDAEAQVDGVMTGQNRNTRSAQRSESFDDGDRQRNVTTTQEEPDVEKFKSIAQQVGRSFANADSDARSNSDQRAKARQTDFETDSGREAQTSTAERAGQLGRGVGVSKGAQQYDSGDDRFSPATGALTAAKVGTEGSKQNENNAQAGKANADVKKLRGDVSGDLKTQNPERLTTTLNAINGLIRTYDEKTFDEATVKDRKELQSMAGQIARELQRRGLGAGAADKPAAPAPAARAAEPSGAPPVGVLKPGVNTKFTNGQVWTLRGGQPVQVK